MTTGEKGRKLVTGASEEMITSANRTLPIKSTLGAESETLHGRVEMRI
jgi:hypothetical protein